MIILDTLLWGGLRFVLNRITEAVEAELNDEERLREELLAAQMRVELGEMTEAQFADLERVVLQRLREIREERKRQAEADAEEAGELKVTGVDASVTWTEDEGDERARR
jgi:outer membrane PBP1 activator LpoA protein